MPVLVSDNFNRADEDPIASPWADVGLAAHIELASNGVGSASPGSPAAAYHTGASTLTDGYCEMVMGQSGSGSLVSPIMRVTPTTGIAFVYAIHFDGTWFMGEYYSGGYHDISTHSGTANDDGMVHRIQVVGDQLSLYINGAHAKTVTLTTVLGSGNFGVYSESDAIFNAITSFECGTLGGDPPVVSLADPRHFGNALLRM